MLWLIEEKTQKNHNLQKMLSAIEHLNSKYQLCEVIPFLGDILTTDKKEVQIDRTDVICIGSYSMKQSAKKFGWNPGVYDLAPFDFRQQLKHWGTELLNFDSLVCEVQFAPIAHQEVFVRPVDNSEVFPSQVIAPNDFQGWKDNLLNIKDTDFYSPKNQLIQICKVKNILKEYRFWIVDGKIISSSQYKSNQQSSIKEGAPKAVIKYVEKVVKKWTPHKAFAIDICETLDSFKITDIKTINSSDFYAGDISAIFTAINTMENSQ